MAGFDMKLVRIIERTGVSWRERSGTKSRMADVIGKHSHSATTLLLSPNLSVSTPMPLRHEEKEVAHMSVGVGRAAAELVMSSG